MPKYNPMGKEHNEKYMSMLRGKAQKGMDHMMNHGNVYEIDSDSQKFDIKRVEPSKMEEKGYSDKAFDYKY